jgi:hypothetical protein
MRWGRDRKETFGAVRGSCGCYEEARIFELSVCSFIAFAKLVHPRQLLNLAKRDYKVDEDS